jgi:hypothetical protein
MAGGLLRLRAPVSGRLRQRDAVAAGRALGRGAREFVLDWNDAASPHAAALGFAHSAFRRACGEGGWGPVLTASADGAPAPVI